MDYKERQQRSSGNIKFTALLKTQTSQKILDVDGILNGFI